MSRWILALLIGVMIPFPQTVVPAWTAQILDESGAPQANLEVRETWQHYSLESRNHSEDRQTDSSGTVSFPRRTIWRPLAANVLGASRKFRSNRADRNVGPVAFLLATRPGAQAFADYCVSCKDSLAAQLTLHSTK